MSKRDELIKVFESNDQLGARRLGWDHVYEAASTWWLPRQPLTRPEFVHYVKALGDEDPAVVLDAFRDTAGEWRPSVGALIGAIKRKRQGGDKRMDAGRSRDSSRSTDALAAVRDALANGEQACGCGSPAGRKWVPDAIDTRTDSHGRRVSIPVGVWRCPDCHGVEPGQALAAEDLPSRPKEAAA